MTGRSSPALERATIAAPWSPGRAAITAALSAIASASPGSPAIAGVSCRIVTFTRTRRASPAPNRLATQRPHSVGCAGSTPTSARQCQQRSHFALRARRSRRPRARRRFGASTRRGRGDHHEAQVVAERDERGVVVAGRRDRRPRPAATSRSCPSWRSASSSFCTAARTARMRVPLGDERGVAGERRAARRSRRGRRSSDRRDARSATPPRP